MSNFHKPVLLSEAIAGLKVKQNERYIDATLGGGGHTIEILRLGGIVLGLDVDKDALEYVKKNYKLQITNYKLKMKEDYEILIPLKILVDPSFPFLRTLINFGFNVSKKFTQRTQRQSQRNSADQALCDLCLYLAFFA